MTLEFPRQNFFKNPQISNFLVIIPEGTELLHADGQSDRRRDMTKLIIALCDFTEAPKIS